MTLETTLAEIRATADLDARAGEPVGKALRRTVAAVEAVTALHRTGTVKIHGGETVETCEECGYTPPCPTVQAIADALNGDTDHG